MFIWLSKRFITPIGTRRPHDLLQAGKRCRHAHRAHAPGVLSGAARAQVAVNPGRGRHAAARHHPKPAVPKTAEFVEVLGRRVRHVRYSHGELISTSGHQSLQHVLHGAALRVPGARTAHSGESLATRTCATTGRQHNSPEE